MAVSSVDNNSEAEVHNFEWNRMNAWSDREICTNEIRGNYITQFSRSRSLSHISYELDEVGNGKDCKKMMGRRVSNQDEVYRCAVRRDVIS
jgi:hypothetical protein